MAATDKLDPIEVHLGSRLRKLRSVCGMSQDQLGKALGLTFQQIQKYESGTNRMAASRLFEICRILNVPVTHFFEDIPQDILAVKQEGFGEDGQELLENIPANDIEHRETLEFARVYSRITSPKLRRRILDMMRAVANEDEE